MKPLHYEEALASYSPSDAVIARMAEEYLPLTVAGVEDREGLALVHAARMEVKKHRVAVEKTRKELKADALEFGRTVDAEAKRLKALLEPIEAHLQAQEDAVAAEKARIKAEAEARRLEVVRARCAKLAALGSSVLSVEVERMSDEEFVAVLREETAAHAERERLAAEEAERRKAEEAERARAEAEAAAARAAEEARLAEMREQLEQERQALEAERRAAAEAETERQLEAKIQAAKEAAERAAYERAKEEAERQQREAEAAEEAERAARELELATRPDREKLEALAVHLEAELVLDLSPELDAPARRVLRDAAARLRALALALCPQQDTEEVAS